GGFDKLTTGGFDKLTTGGFDRLTAGWQSATPQTVGAFTAVGYFFARDLHQKLGVPIGVIHSSWGGTPIESWLSPYGLGADPAFRVVGERWTKMVAGYPALKASFDARLTQWTTAEAAARNRGKAAHDA